MLSCTNKPVHQDIFHSQICRALFLISLVTVNGIKEKALQ